MALAPYNDLPSPSSIVQLQDLVTKKQHLAPLWTSTLFPYNPQSLLVDVTT